MYGAHWSRRTGASSGSAEIHRNAAGVSSNSGME
jgi:hypothetical protein